MLNAEVVVLMKERGSPLIARISSPHLDCVIIQCLLCGSTERIPWAEKRTSEERLQQHKIDCPHITRPDW